MVLTFTFLYFNTASGRRTPHTRTKYDAYIQTPGSADDKPLVSAQVMSARDITPEDEESVRLLDRLVSFL